MDAFRAQLDELMGRDRNLSQVEKKNFKDLDFTDNNVCKWFQGLSADERKKYTYELDFLHYLEGIVGDLDRRIAKGHERLDDVPIESLPNLDPRDQFKIQQLTDEIADLLSQVEALGEEGNIDQAELKMQRVEGLKKQKEDLILLAGVGVQRAAQGDKRMKVCDTCGAFLVVGDTEKRTSSHMEGKQHVGYDRIRKEVETLKRRLADRILEEASRREERRDSRSDRGERRDDRGRGRPDSRRDYDRRDDRRDYDRRRSDRDRDRRDSYRRDDRRDDRRRDDRDRDDRRRERSPRRE